jgi:pyrroline-5-carboxylate reductase
VKAIVFLGGGRITSALVAGLRLAKYDAPIVVHDRHPEKLKKLKREYGVIAEKNLQHAVESADLLIIAVRPSSVAGLLDRIRAFRIKQSFTVVSLAAGIPLSKLERGLPPPVRWIRAMPSPVCRVGKGLTALAYGRGVSAAQRKETRELFALVGGIVEIPEKQFDAFTVTFSSSQGYHALAVLTEAAQKVGLDSKTAELAAAHALADSIATWREGDSSLGELLEEAATPGGTAAATMAALDKAGYRRILKLGLRAGVARARKNARNMSSNTGTLIRTAC